MHLKMGKQRPLQRQDGLRKLGEVEDGEDVLAVWGVYLDGRRGGVDFLRVVFLLDDYAGSPPNVEGLVGIDDVLHVRRFRRNLLVLDHVDGEITLNVGERLVERLRGLAGGDESTGYVGVKSICTSTRNGMALPRNSCSASCAWMFVTVAPRSTTCP
jgi:hypothetical protein